MVVQAQMLKILLTSKKLKETMTLLGIRKSTKDKQMKENVIQNINSALKSIGRYIKKIDSDAHREINWQWFHQVLKIISW